MPEHHAEYSPSSLEALALCPARKRLSAAWVERNGAPPDNPAAVEGTRLHGLAEHKLLDLLASRIPAALHPDDAELVDEYVDYIMGLVKQAKDPDAIVLPEHKTHIYPDPVTGEWLCWGTSDCCLYFPATRVAHIVDAKFGRLQVSPHTLQLQAYGYGWLQELELLYGEGCVDELRCTIVQPKIKGEER